MSILTTHVGLNHKLSHTNIYLSYFFVFTPQILEGKDLSLLSHSILHNIYQEQINVTWTSANRILKQLMQGH